MPGGSRRNLEYVSSYCTFDPALTEAHRLVLADAQTSGGLLIASSNERSVALVSALKRAGVHESAVIGQLDRIETDEPCIRVAP